MGNTEMLSDRLYDNIDGGAYDDDDVTFGAMRF